MNSPNDDKLNNPVWHSLCESHQQFSINYPGLKCYHPDYCAFGSFQTANTISAYIDAYSALVDNFFIVGEKPELSNQLQFKKEVACLQMICADKIGMDINEEIVPLTDEHNDRLYQLVNLVQPGYFKRKTALLGRYYGIFKNEMLVAITGERMKMDDFTEVSAVVTHPDYTGQGYAKQLVACTVNTIFSEKKVPYLHVAEGNTGAIQLYKKLGFTIRRKMSFWNITK